ASMGFVLMNKIQIITGSLDGTSGFLLSLLMCRAMNRSAMNVLFGAFGKIEKQEVGPAAEAMGTVRSITPEELTVLFDSIRSVIVVPGYGMAVAQAQHGVSELAKLLSVRGIDVKYAIHPVAGRMPGHMNDLLEVGPAAEAMGTVRSITPEELTVLFDSIRSVIVVPGYGMAVAQAQHGVSELAKLLSVRGIDVKYAIHPVAGRMPGHMNVLLAEAN